MRTGSAVDDALRVWINAREQHLAERSPIPVCSFDWGTEALADIPGFEPANTSLSELDVLRKANEWWLRNKTSFFAYQTPTDFRLQGTHLQFSSAAKSLYPENETVHADYFPSANKRRAVLVIPHWNADPAGYANFCRYLNFLGFSALLVTLPYHGKRKPPECVGAEYSVSPNIGRTIACARQGVIDTLCCLDWLTSQGCRQIGIVGSSLGFGHAFVASALDPRLRVNVFNHCCSTVSDALWAGMPQFRAVLERHISQQQLRQCWSVINPISYIDSFGSLSKQSLLLVGKYDTTFARDYVEEAIRPFQQMGLDHQVVELACGHRTISDLPYLLMSAYHVGKFLKTRIHS